MADRRLRYLGRRDRTLEVDIDVNSTVPQQIDQVLGGDVSAGARRERAAAEAAHGGVEPGDAGGHRGVGTGQPGAAGVVEVRPERDVADQRPNLSDQVADPPRRRGADGVRDRQPVDVVVTGHLHDVEHPLRRRRAVERAVPGGGDDDLHRSAAVVRDGDDLGDQFCRLRGGASDVRPAVAVSRRHHVLDGMQAGRDRPLCPVRTGDESGELDAVEVAQFGGEFGGIGEGGHLRRRDERRRLHLPHAGGGDGGEQFELGRQRNRILDLQTVAERDIANVDVGR